MLLLYILNENYEFSPIYKEYEKALETIIKNSFFDKNIAFKILF